MAGAYFMAFNVLVLVSPFLVSEGARLAQAGRVAISSHDQQALEDADEVGGTITETDQPSVQAGASLAGDVVSENAGEIFNITTALSSSLVETSSYPVLGTWGPARIGRSRGRDRPECYVRIRQVEKGRIYVKKLGEKKDTNYLEVKMVCKSGRQWKTVLWGKVSGQVRHYGAGEGGWNDDKQFLEVPTCASDQNGDGQGFGVGMLWKFYTFKTHLKFTRDFPSFNSCRETPLDCLGHLGDSKYPWCHTQYLDPDWFGVEGSLQPVRADNQASANNIIQSEQGNLKPPWWPGTKIERETAAHVLAERNDAAGQSGKGVSCFGISCFGGK